MARAKALEGALEELSAVRGDPTSTGALATLRKVLAGKSSHAAAAAANLAGEFELQALVPDLVAAFDRLLVQPLRSDPGCAGKAAIANALYRIGAAEIGVYLKGIRHLQLEPVWGGKADTATQLRGTCGLALVRVHYPDYLVELAERLADQEAPVRKMAAQALAYSENPAAVPLLRLKALVGDPDPQVLGEILLALLAIAPAASLAFAAGFLDRPEEDVAETAALALGGSRLKEALALLTAWWERTFDPGLRRSALLAIAMLKHDDAIQYLLTHVAESAPLHAREAIRALAVYRHDPRLRAQLETVVARRHDASLRGDFTDAFGAP
jgi:HEAT repeat protein